MTKNLLSLINNNFKKSIAEAIDDGLGQSTIDAKISLSTKTHNAHSPLIWDLINTNLFNIADTQTAIAKSGFWEFIILLDKKSNCIFTFMRKERLNDILKDKKRESPHYIEALVQLNEDLKAQCTQIHIQGITPIEKFDKDFLQEKLEKLCNNLLSKKKRENIHHIIITFSSSNFSLTSLKANVFNSKLEFVDEESWNEFIPTNYNFDIEPEENNNDNIQSDDSIDLSLTEEAIEKIEENDNDKKNNDNQDDQNNSKEG